MEQYLEEKKASQKRPAATFQRQDKKKVVYQTQQRSVAVGSSQVPSVHSLGVKKECPHCGKTHGGTECWMITGKCLKCGSSDHKIKDCSRLQQGVQRGAPAPAVATTAPATGRPGRPRAPARVFALAREDAEQAEHVTEEFWPKASLASISIDVDVVSASTIWTPTLTPASSDVDANFSDLHVLQSPKFPGTSYPNHWGAVSNGLKAFLSDLHSWSIREGFPDLALVSTSVKNPEEGVFGGFLGLPKESFTTILDPFGVFFRGKQELGVNALDAEIPGVVGDDTLAEEAVETDSERFEGEELRKKLGRSFLPTISPPFGLSSWSSNLLA
ncbi:hypothetical protein Taro_034612 [Colocasia esculenta]|uniref:CCHC-type domain-containing protein n=1 Tax=Colocasia esculenta TaxID=4460 RepID=A0A843WG03_COLES|nr:hypothetical protein [Colocasia esculenta]